jgi:hypothetical protein
MFSYRKEAVMYSNNLNGAYEYECERRHDERRAAAKSQRLRDLGDRRKLSVPSFMTIIGVLAVLLAVIRAI